MIITIQHRLPGILLTIVGALLMFHTFDEQYSDVMAGLQFGPVFFPQIILGIWLCISVASIFFIPEALVEAFEKPRKNLKAVFMALLLLVYVLSLDVVGFVLASLVMATLAQYLLGYQSIFKAFIWAAVMTLGCWAAFEFIIGIPLPSAELF